MDFKPMSANLFAHCISETSCQNCTHRKGCNLRYNFYADDIQFEIVLQSFEILALSLDDANGIRRKRQSEMRKYPIYSNT